MITDIFYINQIQEIGLVKCAVTKYSVFSADIISRLLKISIHMVNYHRNNKKGYPTPNYNDNYIRIDYGHLDLLCRSGIKMDILNYGVISLLESYSRTYGQMTFVDMPRICSNLSISKRKLIMTLRMAEKMDLIETAEIKGRVTRRVTEKWKSTKKESLRYDLLGNLNTSKG